MADLFWYGDEGYQALVDDGNGRVLATISHDGYGKFAVLLYVSLFSAVFWRLLAKQLRHSWAVRDYPNLRWWAFEWIALIKPAVFPIVRLWMGDKKEMVAFSIIPWVEYLLGIKTQRESDSQITAEPA